MNNQTAIFLALLIAGIFLADSIWLHWQLPLFLGRRFTELIEYLSFWR